MENIHNLQLELFKQVNGSPLYLANQLSILSLGYLKHWLIFFVIPVFALEVHQSLICLSIVSTCYIEALMILQRLSLTGQER